METYTDDEIKKIVEQYKNKREREHKQYHEVSKHDEEWRKENCKKSSNFYKTHKDHYKDKYIKNQEYIKARNLYRYYLRNNKVEEFKVKHPDKYKYLDEGGYDVTKNPNTPKPTIQDFFNIVDN